MANLFVSDLTHEYYVDILRALVDRGHTAKVVKTSSRPGYRPANLTAFLEETKPRVLSAEDFHYPERFEEICDPDFSVLSLRFFADVAYYEKMFLLTSDRLAFWPLPVAERVRLFYLHLAHFYKIINAERVDAVFFSAIPHGITEIALFALAKGLRLKVLYVDWPGFGPHFSTIETEIASRRGDPDSQFQPARGPDDGQAALFEQFKAESMAPPVWKAFTAPSRLRVLARTVAGLLLRAPFGVYEQSSAFFLNRGPRRRAGYIWPLIKYYLQTERVVRFYSRHSRREIPGDKAAVFFLHLEPESSTLPQGGFFADQQLAFDMILQALPKGMKLFVKEHPAMFTKFGEDRHFRSIDYYAHMLKDDRVVLLDQSVDSQRLLEQACYVLSINGSINWEAMRIGKPSIMFGWAWFAPCPSCYVVDSVDGLKAAFAAASAKTPAEVLADVDRFLESFSKRLIHAVPNHSALNFTDPAIDYQQSVRNLAAAVDGALNAS